MPRTSNGVAESHEDGGVDHEEAKLDPLGDRTRNDGGGGGSKHGLEDEVTVSSHGE